MNHVARPGRRDRLKQFREERPIESDFVPDHMNNNDPERQRLEIVLVPNSESAVGGDEYITVKRFTGTWSFRCCQPISKSVRT